MEAADVIKLLIGTIVTLGGIVGIFWRLLDSRGAKAVKDASDRADRYEDQRDKAMEANIAHGNILNQILKQQAESDARCREGLARVESQCLSGLTRLEQKLDSALIEFRSVQRQ